jgi:hypothetical protein
MPAARTRPALAGVLAALAASGASAQTVIYVNGSLTTGAGTGASWADACRGAAALQDALDAATPIAGAGQTVQVWVAAGTYVPTARTAPADPTTATFTFLSHEEIYGGFVGNETALGQRDPASHTVRLSGLLAPSTAKTVHIITVSGVDASCIVDGLTISGGFALGTGADRNGGGIYGVGASPLIRFCRITSNSAANGGGGAALTGGSPRFEDCGFDANTSWEVPGGGALYGDALTVVRCAFTSNYASGASGPGGAVSGSATITSCTFVGNRGRGAAAVRGSVTCTDSTFDGNGWGPALAGSGIVSNCTFVHNSGDDGPGSISGDFDVQGSTFGLNGSGYSSGVGYATRFTDCIFQQNSSTYSAVIIADTLSRCRFDSNDGPGTGLAVVSSEAQNCVFRGLQGPVCLRGGAVLSNCTFLNAGNFRGAVRVYDAGRTASVRNCVLWGITGNSSGQASQLSLNGGQIALSYSDVQGLDGSLGGVGNFSADPHLDADGRLLSPSPCIDAGDSGAVPAGMTLDAFGQARFVDDPGMPNTGPVVAGLAPVDIGAFEFQGVTCYANCDGSTAAPVLNAADFGCFLNAFAARSPYANCDASSAAPTLNVLDFSCFLRRFAAGCP